MSQADCFFHQAAPCPTEGRTEGRTAVLTAVQAAQRHSGLAVQAAEHHCGQRLLPAQHHSWQLLPLSICVRCGICLAGWKTWKLLC